MRSIILVLTIPLVVLNMVGGVVSGVWLAILGLWWAIGYGLLVSFTAPFLLGFTLLPGLLLGAPAMAFIEKGHDLFAYFFMFLAAAYTSAIIALWCIGILVFFVSDAGSNSLVPLLIWSYGVALAPWIYMAQKEKAAGSDSGAETISIFFAEIAYVIVAIVAIFNGISIEGILYVFGVSMTTALVFQFASVISAHRQLKKLD